MHTREAFFQRVSPYLLSVMRIVVAFLFLAHGSQKLFGFPPSEHHMAGPLPTLILLAGILEFYGGALLLFGIGTRAVAFVLSGQMAVAFFKAHMPHMVPQSLTDVLGFLPIQNGGELAVLYSFVFLFLATAGGGPWSVDRLFRRQASVAAQEERERAVT